MKARAAAQAPPAAAPRRPRALLCSRRGCGRQLVGEIDHNGYVHCTCGRSFFITPADRALVAGQRDLALGGNT